MMKFKTGQPSPAEPPRPQHIHDPNFWTTAESEVCLGLDVFSHSSALHTAAGIPPEVNTLFPLPRPFLPSRPYSSVKDTASLFPASTG